MVTGISRHARGVAPAKGVWRRRCSRRLLAAAAAAAAIMAIGVPVAGAEAGTFLAAAPPGIFTPLSSGIARPLCMDDWTHSPADHNPVVIHTMAGPASQRRCAVHAG